MWGGERNTIYYGLIEIEQHDTIERVDLFFHAELVEKKDFAATVDSKLSKTFEGVVSSKEISILLVKGRM